MSISDKEFLGCTHNGEEYREMLEYARRLADEVGVVIARRGENEPPGRSSVLASRISWDLGTAIEKREAALAVADLFHELGHSRQPPLNPADPAAVKGSPEQRAREEAAWNLGLELARACDRDVPVGFWAAFEIRRAKGLSTYGSP